MFRLIADSISGDLGVGNDDITNLLRLLIFPSLLELPVTDSLRGANET